MTSIHHNTGAMVALSTLSSINNELLETQSAISTGKEVSDSSQDAAIWAVTTVMEADVDGFNAISESLSLGKATVTVARNASEKVTELLRDVKEKVVTAQGENVDRDKIQTDIDELRNQIESVVGAAQFNGLNLIDGTSETDVAVLASLDRSSTNVTSSDINVARQDLSVDGGSFGAAAATFGTASAAALDASDDGTATFTVVGGTAAADFFITIGDSTASLSSVGSGVDDGYIALDFAQQINDLDIAGISAEASGSTVTVTNTGSFNTFEVEAWATGGGATMNGNASGSASPVEATIAASGESLTLSGRTVTEGDSYRLTLTKDTDGDGANNTINFDYIANENDTVNDVAEGLKALVEADDNFSEVSIELTRSTEPTLNDAVLRFDTSTSTIGFATSAATGGTAGGGLGDLATLSVTSATSAANALETIETLIQTSVDAAAAFGSSEKRLEIQEDFVKSLVDSMQSGIGALVDTDMEAASARLQALQVQQQLATQSLSIANGAPQNILSLFR